MDLVPIYRNEFFLDAIVNNSVNPYSPEYRVEYYLAKIAGENVTIPEPIYRKEFYLAYLCGEEVELPDPIYRIEYYLAFLCGLNVAIPEPIYRVEFWLWDWCGGGGIEKTVTGNPIHILDALAKPAQALSVKLEPIQDLHGYDSPWPAGGGKNKFAICDAVGIAVKSACYYLDIDIDAVNETIRIHGTPSWTASGSYSFRVIVTEAGYWGTAPVDHDYTGYYAFTEIVSKSSNITSDPYLYISSSATINIGSLIVSDTNAIDITLRLSLNPTSTPTAWTPYSNICPISGHTDADVIVSPTLNQADGTTYPIPLGQTVYGGTLDVTSGVLTVTKVISNARDGAWTYIDSGRVYREFPLSPTELTTPLCSHCEYHRRPAIGEYDNWIDWGGYPNSNKNLIVTLNGITDTLSQWNSYIQNNDVQFVYELATPQTIQLTPTQVELLQGENNLFSDGEMTLVYLADGNASDEEALNILLGGRYVNNHTEDEPTDREALNIILGGNER